MAEKEMRNFALRDEKGNEIGVFTGKSPRQAALKAANRGHTDIRLRERGTKKVHVFTGERCRWTSPKERLPGWETRSGSRRSKRWASRSWKRFEDRSDKIRGFQISSKPHFFRNWSFC